MFEGEAEVLLGEDIFLEQVGAEHGRIVGVEGDHEPGVEVAAEGMRVQRGAAAGAEVGGDVDLQRDLTLGEHLEELGVVLGGQGVANALGADVDGGPDAGGAVDGAAGLAGVGGEAEAVVAGLGI